MSEATDMYALYIQAEKNVLEGKMFRMDGRILTRENLPEIIKGRNQWKSKVNAENAAAQGGSRLASVADFR